MVLKECPNESTMINDQSVLKNTVWVAKNNKKLL